MSYNEFSGPDDSFARQPDAQLPQLPGYQITAKIGEGGMGTVWRATQISTRRQVAIKFISSSSTATERGRRRFEREVDLASRLVHPGIARVYEAGQHRHVFYFTMELIEGKPLDAFAHDAGLTPRAIVELIHRVCEAVRHAHQRGVIHRDLKPANILVTPDGQPHVLDFGLAKAIFDEDDPAGITITHEGFAAGTPEFMSPEQAAGDNLRVDTRTDVYALGVVLYRLLTHDHPHDLTGTRTRYDILERIKHTDIRRPRRVRREIDADLEAILMKALARDIAERYSTAGDLADDLARYLAGDAVLARPMTLRYLLFKQARKHRGAIALAATLLLLLVGVAVLSVVSIALERSAASAKQTADRATRDARLKSAANLIAQGDTLASKQMRSDWVNAKALYRDAVAMLERMGEPPDEAHMAMWAACRASPPALVKIDLGGKPACIAALPDGRHVVIGIDRELREYDLLTGAVRATFTGHEAAVTAVAVAPGGSELASGDASGQVILWDRATRRPRTRMKDLDGPAVTLAFQRQGRELLAGGGTSVARYNTGTGQLLRCVTMEMVHPDHEIGVRHIEVCPDGQLLITATSNRAEYWDADLQTLDRRMMMQVFGNQVRAALISRFDGGLITPDGNRVNVRDVKKSEIVRQMFYGHTRPITAIATGPDDERIVTGGEDNTVRVLNLRFHTQEQVYTDHTAPVRGVCVIPGVPVIASISDDTTCRAWTVNELDSLFSFRPNHMTHARFMRDRRMALIVQDEDEHPEIKDVVTGQMLLSFALPSRNINAFALTADEQSVVFEVDHGGLEMWCARAGRRHWKLPPVTNDSDDIYAIAFAPNGQMITCSRTGWVRCWDVSRSGATLVWSEQFPKTADRREVGAFCLAFVAEGVAVGFEGGQIAVHSMRDGKILRRVKAHDEYIRALCVTPDGRYVLSGGWNPDTTVRVWDTRTADGSWELVYSLRSHVDGVQRIAVTADGRYAASGDEQSNVVVWDLKDGRLVRSFEHPGSGLGDIAFDGVGRLYCAGLMGGGISRWEFAAPRVMERPPEAWSRLAHGERDAAALGEVGQWYLSRGVRRWGIALLSEAKAAGGEVDAIPLAQARWTRGIDDYRGAIRELQNAPPHDATEHYMDLLNRSLRAQNDSTAGNAQ